MIPTWAERCEKFGDEIVTNAMIQRMMQEEIDELRSKIDKMLDDTVSLTDDLFSERKEVLQLEAEIERLGSELNRIVELYTDKAIENEALKLRELTDEEITQCLNESMDIKDVWGQPMSELNPVNFARAILKKASEI